MNPKCPVSSRPHTTVTSAAITVENRAGVLHAVMRDPPRNAVGEALIEALATVVEEFERGEAKVLMLSSALPEFRAAEAWRIGLIERLLPGDVVEQSLEIATALTASSALAMAAAMVCVDAARDLPHESGLAVEGAALVSTAEDSDIADRPGRQAAA